MCTSSCFDSARYLENKKANSVCITYKIGGNRHQASILLMSSVTILTGQGTPGASCMGLCHSWDGEVAQRAEFPRKPAVTKCHTESRIFSFSGFFRVGKYLLFAPSETIAHFWKCHPSCPSTTISYNRPHSRHWAPRWPNHPQPGRLSPLVSSQEQFSFQNKKHFVKITASLQPVWFINTYLRKEDQEACVTVLGA